MAKNIKDYFDFNYWQYFMFKYVYARCTEPIREARFFKIILININNKLLPFLKNFFLNLINVKGSVTDELGLSVIGGSMPQA